MTRLGGPADLQVAVAAAGRQVGPRTEWFGSWVLKSGMGHFPGFFSACKRDGVEPLVQVWWWGDQISPAAILNGVHDKGQGVFKTAQHAYDHVRTLARMAKAAGVRPIFVLEPEGTKGGTVDNPGPLAAYLDNLTAIIRAECPGARTCFASAIWVDQRRVATAFAPQIRAADLIGVQTLLFQPQHPLDQFRTAGDNLAGALAILRSSTQKPICVYDLGFSTYGGAYSKTHPFPGGDGRAGEGLQREALEGVARTVLSLDPEFIIYRSLRDAPGFNVNDNFGGYAERFVGVIRSDGTAKPGRDAMLSLASPRHTRTEAEFRQVQERLDTVTQERDAAVARLQAVRRALDGPTA